MTRNATEDQTAEAAVSMPDLDAGWRFYRLLGLEPIVDARPHYLRFRRTDGGGTVALDRGSPGDGQAVGGPLAEGRTALHLDCSDLDRMICALRDAGIAMAAPLQQDDAGRAAEIRDPGGNRVVLHEVQPERETKRAA